LNKIKIEKEQEMKEEMKDFFNFLRAEVERSKESLSPRERSLYREALYSRTCPPEAMLYAVKMTPECKSHLDLCQSCREKSSLKKEWKEWKKISRKILKGVVSEKEKKTPATGQIWSLKKNLGGWSTAVQYYKPPMVLLIEKERLQKQFRVAQIYHNPMLADHRDVGLGYEYGFAEAWNIFTVPVDCLETYCGKVAGGLVKKVKELERMPEYPDIVFKKRYLAFQKLEKDVANFMKNKIELAGKE
jgi:hypothetical protein